MFYCFRPSNKEGRTDWGTLTACVTRKGKRYYFSTKIRLKRNEWLKYFNGDYIPSVMVSSQKIKYGIFVGILSQLKAMLDEETDLTRIPHILSVTKEEIAHYQRIHRNRETKVSMPSAILFTHLYQQYIEELESGKRLKYKTSEKVAESTIIGHKSTLKAVMRYEYETEHHFTLDEMTIDFQRHYLQWRVSKGILPNTLSGDMYKIRLALKVAYEMQLTKNRDYQRRDFVPKNEEVENVFLTPAMIEELEKLDVFTKEGFREAIKNSNLDEQKKVSLLRGQKISKRWTLLRTKDLFLLGCYTGQRFSDYSRIEEKMIVEYGGRKFIKLIQQKEKKKVMIPLDKRILPILERHRGAAPKIPDYTLNSNIKLIGEILGWTWESDFVPVHIGCKAGPRFCDMLSSHTARRTFATNAYAAGVPIKSIMAVTGHSTEEKLKVYLKLLPNDKAMMASRDFDGYIDKVKTE